MESSKSVPFRYRSDLPDYMTVVYFKNSSWSFVFGRLNYITVKRTNTSESFSIIIDVHFIDSKNRTVIRNEQSTTTIHAGQECAYVELYEREYPIDEVRGFITISTDTTLEEGSQIPGLTM